MKKLLQSIFLALGSLATSAAPIFAQEDKFIFPRDQVPFTNLGALLANVLVLLFIFAAVLAFVFVVVGGIQWITAGGDPKAAQSARDRITAAVVGLVIVVAAFALTLIITNALGINIFREGGIKLPGPPGGVDIFQ